MRYLRKYYQLFIAFLLAIFFCCQTTSAIAKDDPSPNESTQQSQSEDPNFIPAPRLNSEKINSLWDIAVKKCYDVGYMVSNNDKATKNLICTKQEKGDTITLRVQFTDEGIYVIRQASGTRGILNKWIKIKTTDHKEMKAALIAGLK